MIVDSMFTGQFIVAPASPSWPELSRWRVIAVNRVCDRYGPHALCEMEHPSEVGATCVTAVFTQEQLSGFFDARAFDKAMD